MKPNLKSVVQKLIDEDIETKDYYFGKDASLAEERTKLHDKIVAKIIDAKDYSRDRKVYILGGAPANGKSAFLKSKFCPYPNKILKIDPDEIKKFLPEYNLMVAMNQPRAASLVHEESSFIAKIIRAHAIEEGIDIVLDGIADHSINDRKKVYNEFKNYGYYIRMDYVSLDTKLSLKLAKIREKETGRSVPVDFIKLMNSEISKLVPQLLKKMPADELYLWDTNLKDKPVLVLCLKDRTLEVYDENLYKNFLNKYNGDD